MGTVATPEAKTGGNLKVEVRRVIRASRQRVYEAWTRPEELRKWLAPGQMSVAAAETNPSEGGGYRIELKGSMDGLPENAGRRTCVHGVYTRLVPNELVSFTWNPDWNTEGESQVTIRLSDVEGGTEMVLTHERIATDSTRAGYTQGWNSCLDKLANAVGR
jgi:uncharacterized protein YndB with AHSA1/START domain